MKKKYSIQKEITIIYNAVERKKSNIEGDKNSSPLRKAVLQGSINRSNISEPNKIILYQGACTAGRGIEIIVKAMPKINEEWILVIMGWGEYIKYLKILSKKIKVENRIVFLPPASQDELIKWTTGADIGIIPYVNNCLNHLYCSPNKLWEYPFAGVPIIAPDFPFLGYMINKYQIGWTLKEMNPHYLSECINLITKSDLLEKSKKFPHFIEEECWEHSLDRLIKIYTDLLKRIEK